MTFATRSQDQCELDTSWAKRLPSSPGLSPHCWLVVLVWGEVVAVEAIASVNLR
jgi:hypothetical protein